MCPVFFPDEANSELVIYPNAVLACPVAFESFQAVSGRLLQIVQCQGEVDEIEFPQSNFGNIRKVTLLPAKKQFLRLSVFERPNHPVGVLSHA